MCFVWAHLDLNRHPQQSTLLSTLGIGNWLSIFRCLCIAMLAGFLFSPRPPGVLAWAPAALYTISLVGDYFDGFAARRSNRVTLLGDALDMELDVTEMTVAVGLLIWYGTLPWWLFPLGAVPYLLVVSLWLLRSMGNRRSPAWSDEPPLMADNLRDLRKRPSSPPLRQKR